MMEFTTGPVPVGKVLQAAEIAKLTEVFIIGYEPNGDTYLASSTGDTDILRDMLIEGDELVTDLERQEREADEDDDADLGDDEDE